MGGCLSLSSQTSKSHGGNGKEPIVDLETVEASKLYRWSVPVRLVFGGETRVSSNELNISQGGCTIHLALKWEKGVLKAHFGWLAPAARQQGVGVKGKVEVKGKDSSSSSSEDFDLRISRAEMEQFSTIFEFPSLHGMASPTSIQLGEAKAALGAPEIVTAMLSIDKIQPMTVTAQSMVDYRAALAAMSFDRLEPHLEEEE